MANSVLQRPPKRLAKQRRRQGHENVKGKQADKIQITSLQSSSILSQLESLCETQPESVDDSRHEQCLIVNIPATVKSKHNSSVEEGSSDGLLIIRLLTSEIWSDEGKAVGIALARLANLCCSNDVGSPRAKANAMALFQAGGHLAIVQAMKKHAGSSELQEHGCRALRNISSWNEGGSKLLLAAIGGIEAVLNAMRMFSEDEGVQDHGCWAIANMIFDEPENTRLVEALQGTRVVVAAMKMFPKADSLQRACCQSIRCLSEKPRARNLLRSEGAVKAVAEAYLVHTEESGVRVVARQAMRELLGYG